MERRSSGWLFFLPVVGILLPGNAQGLQVIQDCDAPCSLELTVEVELGDTTGAGDGFVGTPAALVRRADGSFLLADRLDPGHLKLYDADGAFVRRVGRAGEGPGEFRLVNALLPLPGDSVEAIDIGQRRSTVLGPNLEVGRMQPYIGGVATMIRTSTGEVVSAGRIPGPDSEGLPLHVFDEAGQVERSFGAEPRLNPEASQDLFYRQLASVVGSDTFWSASLTSYVLEEWGSDGSREQRLERFVDWFPAHDDFGTGGPDGAGPAPGIVALHVDEGGLLWVAIAVPDARWREAFGPERTRLGELVVDHNVAYDTIVEVVSPEDGRVVARDRVNARIIGFAANGHPFSVRESGTGDPVIQIWRGRPFRSAG